MSLLSFRQPGLISMKDKPVMRLFKRISSVRVIYNVSGVDKRPAIGVEDVSYWSPFIIFCSNTHIRQM